MNYQLIASDEDLIRESERFETKPFISVDFEGEFNLHVYGEHLCLIQVFDGDNYFVIDPRSGAVTAKGLERFFSSAVEKLWFDCQSDLSLVRKNYGLEIANIYDIRVLAMLTGRMGNLTSLIEEFLHVETKEGGSKKKNQQANWMLRPIREELIGYALGDVEYLHLLKPLLLEEVEKAGKSKDISFFMKKAVEKREAKPGWTKLGNWKKMSRSQKLYMKEFYIARDAVARRFNLPAHHVLDKHRMVEAALSTPKTSDEAFRLFGPVSKRFEKPLHDSFEIAFSRIEKEGTK
jgi:Ribonuclease D